MAHAISTFTPTSVIPMSSSSSKALPLHLCQPFLPRNLAPFSRQSTPLSLSRPLDHCNRSRLLLCMSHRVSPNGFANDPYAIEKSSFQEIELEVRVYELDQYGVVQNAVYAHYCQHANHQLLECIGVDVYAVDSSDCVHAFSSVSLTFPAPLRIGDKFVVKTRISYTGVRVFFENFIYKLPNREPILEAKTVGVFLNKSYRPVRVPSEVKSKLRQIMGHDW